MNRVQKEAAKDAAEYAAAQMAYGEGAGTRRRLIITAAEFKAARMPGYHQAFEKAVAGQDLTKHIKNAKRSARNKKVGSVVGKNVRGIVKGDARSMSTPLIVGIVAIVVAHETGYDQKAWDYTKLKTSEARAWLKSKL